MVVKQVLLKLAVQKLQADILLSTDPLHTHTDTLHTWLFWVNTELMNIDQLISVKSQKHFWGKETFFPFSTVLILSSPCAAC